MNLELRIHFDDDDWSQGCSCIDNNGVYTVTQWLLDTPCLIVLQLILSLRKQNMNQRASQMEKKALKNPVKF